MNGLWKLPELWTQNGRVHKLLGRRQTNAGAHSYHSPRSTINSTKRESYTPNHWSRPRSENGRF